MAARGFDLPRQAGVELADLERFEKAADENPMGKRELEWVWENDNKPPSEQEIERERAWILNEKASLQTLLTKGERLLLQLQ